MNKITKSMAFDEGAVIKYSENEILNILISRFSERLEFYFPDLESDKVKITGKTWSKQTGITWVFRLDISSGDSTHFVFIKLCSLLARYNPAVVEYSTLKLLHGKMPEMLSVPRPLDIYDDLNAYAMESVGTIDLKSFLLKNNSKLHSKDSDRALVSTISGTARWLSAFHNLAGSGKTENFDYLSFSGNNGDDFDYRRLSEFGFKKATLLAIEDIMERLSSLNGTLDVPYSKKHGDFTPSHVFVDHEQISAIDILGLYNAPIYEDIGHFTASMSMVNAFPFYPQFDYDKCHSKLCDVFIDSYLNESNADVDEFILFSNAYKLKYLIRWFGAQYMVACNRTRPFLGKMFAESILVGRYERSIAHVIDELSKRLK